MISVEGEFVQKVLEIPVLIKLTSNYGSGFYGVIGPSVVLLQRDFEIEERAEGSTYKTSIAPDNYIVYSIVAGLGYDIPLASGLINLEVKYAKNLTLAFDEDSRPFNVNGLKFTFRYGFKL